MGSVLLIMVFLFFAGIIFFVMVGDYGSESKKKREKRHREEERDRLAIENRKRQEEKLTHLPNFEIFDNTLISSSNYLWVLLAFDNTNKKFAYIGNTGEPHIHSYLQILDFEVIKGKETIYRETTSKRSTSGTLGRAIVGDLLLGPVGALAGAMSSESKGTVTETVTEGNTKVRIIFKDFDSKSLSLNMTQEKAALLLPRMKDIFSKIIASNSTEKTNNQTSMPDELLKLFELKEKGMISESECEDLKRKIIGN